MMKILFKQFLGKSHSWSYVGQNLARAFIKQGHQVDLFSTNGLKWFPGDLNGNLIGSIEENSNVVSGRLPDNDYDLNISYTFLRNFKNYLYHGDNKFGIWCYEWKNLPVGAAKYHNDCDLILAPSQFAKECFVNSKVPENKVVVVPHGINLEDFENKTKYKLKTKKSKKILVNIGQAHKRKNIRGVFEAYFKAFTNKDDVCLVAKISKNEMKFPFDVDPVKTYNEIKQKYGKNGPEVELIIEYVPNMIELYNACDIVFSMTHCEGFLLPSLETIGAKKINVCSRYGGQLDFLNDNNSLLIEGKEVKASMDEQYWGGHPNNTHFEPSIDDTVSKLRQSINNTENLTARFNDYNKNIIQNYTWDNVSKKIEGLCK
jgi:glycosyltransferase involved in cell wall biosynthesis